MLRMKIILYCATSSLPHATCWTYAYIAMTLTHTYMKEHKDIYVLVVKKCMLDDTNTCTLMKHKHKGHTNE